MKLKTLETKCSVCGAKNAPTGFTVEIGSSGPKVKAEYYCGGEIRRIFRRAKSCQTKYGIVLCNDAAERVEREIYLAGSMSYGAKKRQGEVDRGI